MSSGRLPADEKTYLFRYDECRRWTLPLAKLALLLPMIAAAAIFLQVVILIESRVADVSSGLLIAILDAALFLMVLRLCSALRRELPLPIRWVVFGMLLLTPLSGLLLPGGGSAILGVVGFVLTAMAWSKGGRPMKIAQLRGGLALAILTGMAFWSVLLALGLGRVRDAFWVRTFFAAGLAVPSFLYLQHVACCLRDHIRLSEGLFLLGIFVVFPGIAFGSFAILGGPESSLASARVGLYYALFAFVATATAWSMGDKPAEEKPAPPAGTKQPS
jgi:hypothetical protein